MSSSAEAVLPGIQAALYIKRANLSVMVIGKDGGSLSRTDKVANYFGGPCDERS